MPHYKKSEKSKIKSKRNIYFVVYSGSALLDFSGPSGVFSAANELLDEEVYTLTCVSSGGGLVEQNTGLKIDSVPFAEIRLKESDTVLVIGSPKESLKQAMDCSAIKSFLIEASETCCRYGSICSGALILGEAGLLDGKNASTHWASERWLIDSFKHAKIFRDALYSIDGNLWTSAGVTAGIDMALAMLEQDHGRLLKSQVAKHLLVHAHRSGYQTQFSDILVAQTYTDGKFSELIEWLSDNLDKTIKVEDMADFMAMSPRSFYRHFFDVFNQSPAHFFVQLRLDYAQRLLEAGEAVSIVSTKVGFKSESAFRKAFKVYTGLTPKYCSSLSNPNGV